MQHLVFTVKGVFFNSGRLLTCKNNIIESQCTTLSWQYSTILYHSQIEIHNIFHFKDQLSAVEEESISVAGPEVENLKQTIAGKDREIALLTGELQTLQSQLQGVSNCQLERQQEEEEAIHRWTVETSELKAKLVKVEGEKQEGERQLEAIYQQMEFLKRLAGELREKKCSVLQVDHYACVKS